MLSEIVINQTQTKNALTTKVLKRIQNQLIDALKDPKITAVVIRHSGDDFSAGGDVKGLYYAIEKEDTKAYEEFFFTEYSTDYLVHIFPKPILVLAKGIHFGGGIGISVGAKYRVAHPSSWFSMPETLIGLFPDVGASYFLKKIPWEERLDFVMKAQRVSAQVAKRWNLCDAVIEEQEEFFKQLKLAEENEANMNETIKKLIDKFDAEYGEQIIDSPLSPSPTSQEFAKKQLEIGESLDLKEAFIKEYSYALRFRDNPNLKEGVRALLIDKDKKPKWDNKIDVDSLFLPLEDKKFRQKLDELDKIVKEYE